jgi:hypothetical protein
MATVLAGFLQPVEQRIHAANDPHVLGFVGVHRCDACTQNEALFELGRGFRRALPPFALVQLLVHGVEDFGSVRGFFEKEHAIGEAEALHADGADPFFPDAEVSFQMPRSGTGTAGMTQVPSESWNAEAGRSV